MAQCHDTYEFTYPAALIRAVAGTQCHDTPVVCRGDIELVLERCVRDWVETVTPGDERTAARAVARALGAYAAGASVPEACDQARRLVLGRMHHPSNRPTRVAAAERALSA